MRRYFSMGVIFFLVIVCTRTVQATDSPSFSLTGSFVYELTSNGEVKVREDIVIKNLTTESYVPSFTFDTTGFSPNDVTVFESGLAVKLTQKDAHTYEALFKRPALGKGATKKVSILFTDESLLTKHGKVTEIKIPRVQNTSQFSNIQTTIRVLEDESKSFHIFPQTNGVKNGSYIEYTLNTKDINSNPITAFWGDVAVFDFSLSYPFTNTSYFPREVTFALPPDTSRQKVYIHVFNIQPDSLTYDSDGNWIGKLTLKAKDQQTFTVNGTIFVFAEDQQNFPVSTKEAIDLNLSEQKYWESHDSQIVKLAEDLKTPQAIYDYVVHNLNYDFTKTARPQERLGAKTALSKKNEAICMEFTDLFIALARAAHIPAREVNGFAISGETNKPRALGGNVLHSWPEYYDESQKKWVQVDPTWGNTTGGVDYFSHFDLDHITFVIHGASSTLPQTPGTYETSGDNSELIHIEPSENGQEEPNVSPIITLTPNGFLPWEQKYKLTVENPSGQAIYNIPLEVSSENDTLIFGKNIPSVLPFSKTTSEFSVYPGFFGSKLPRELIVKSSNFEHSNSVFAFGILIMHLIFLLMPLVLVPFLIYRIIKHYAKH